MRPLFFILSCLTVVNNTWALDSFEQKYWNYRNRLLNRFVLVGEPANVCDKIGGYSVPISFYYEKQISIPNSEKRYNAVYLMASDAPKDLAWYLGVLATEYALLKKANKPTSATLRELYYAMRALERIDRKAETYSYPQLYPPGSSNACGDQSLNGFMTRSDADYAYFIELVKQKYTDYPEAIEFVSTFPNPNNLTSDERLNLNFMCESEFIREHGFYGDQRNYFSKDHMGHLLMGLALVKNMCGDAVYNGYDFDAKAIEAASRMLKNAYDNDWILKIPGTTELSNHGDMQESQNAWSEANKFFTGSSLSCGTSYNPFYYCPGSEAFWQGMQTTIQYKLPVISSTAPTSYTTIGAQFANAYFALIAAMTRSWYDYTSIASSAITNPLGRFNSTQGVLESFSHIWNAPLFPLLYYAMHSGSQQEVKDMAISRMNKAQCDGIHYFGQSDSSSISWNTSNVFEKYATSYSNNNTAFLGYYNGLDYMLLHNLYKLNIGQGYEATIFSDETFKNMISYDNITSSKDYSFSSQDFSAIMTTSAKFKAQKSIDFLPGYDSGTNWYVMPGQNYNQMYPYVAPMDAQMVTINCDFLAANFPITSPQASRMEHAESETNSHDTFNTISQTASKSLLTIYPNPTDGNLYIRGTSSIPDLMHIKLTNTMGNIYINKEVTLQSDDYMLDLSPLAAGIYIIEINSKTYAKTFKISKQ